MQLVGFAYQWKILKQNLAWVSYMGLNFFLCHAILWQFGDASWPLRMFISYALSM